MLLTESPPKVDSAKKASVAVPQEGADLLAEQASPELVPLTSTKRVEPLPTAGRGPFKSKSGGVVGGTCRSDYQDVRDAFEANFALNLEVGAQLVVFKDGEVVVDLHGHAGDEEALHE